MDLSPDTHARSRESVASAGSRREPRSEASRSSRRVIQPAPSWVSGIDHEIPRRSLLWWLLGALAIAVPICGVIVDRAWLGWSESAVYKERAEFLRAANDDQDLVVTIEDLRERFPPEGPAGPDAQTLDRLRESIATGQSGAEQLVDARAYVEAVQEATEPFEAVRTNDAGLVRAQVKRLGEDLAEWEEATAAWHRRAETPCGWVAIRAGARDPARW